MRQVLTWFETNGRMEAAREAARTLVARLPRSVRWDGVLLVVMLGWIPLWYGIAAALQLSWSPVFPPNALFLIGLFLCVCAWVGRSDPWAGALGAYIILRGMATPRPLAFEDSVAVTAGVALYGLARSVPSEWVARIKVAGVFAAIVQVPILVMWKLHLPWMVGQPWFTGTLGNSNFAGAFLAIASAWAPPIFLPVFAMGVVLSRSVLACIAFGVMLHVRFPGRWRFPVTVAGGLGVTIVMLLRGADPVPWLSRWDIWRFAVKVWLQGAPIWGFGPAAWKALGAKTQGEVYAQIHNEYLELAFIGGLVALAMLAAWGYRHRAAFARPAAGAVVAAIAVECAAMFPFQTVSVAILSVTALGFATRHDV